MSARRLLTALLAAVLATGGLAASAGAVTLPMPGSALRVQVPVLGLTQLKFKNIVRQGFDVSCGAAAAATILTHYYGDEIEERQLVLDMLRLGDEERIKRQGFSMLEIKRAVEERGYVVSGFKLNSAEEINKLEAPAITLTNTRGYAHFVVIKGVENGNVLIADPAFGHIARPVEEFSSGWDQIVLMVLSNTRDRNGEFAQDRTLKAPVGEIFTLLDRIGPTMRRQAGEF